MSIHTNPYVDIYNPGCSREDIADALSHMCGEKGDDFERQFAVPNYPAAVTTEPCGKEEERPKMRRLYRVYVIDKKAEIVRDSDLVFAEDTEEAKIKKLQKLNVDYDSRIYHIEVEEIAAWEEPEEE